MDKKINKLSTHFAIRIVLGLGLFGIGAMILLLLIQFIFMFKEFTYVKVDPKIENYKFNTRLVNGVIECNPQFGVKYIYNNKDTRSTVEIINPHTSVSHMIRHITINK
jgi:hypothetical protein